jgi:TonB family protein
MGKRVLASILSLRALRKKCNSIPAFSRIVMRAGLPLWIAASCVHAQPAAEPGARLSAQQAQAEPESMRMRREARPNMGEDQSILRCPNSDDPRCAERARQDEAIRQRIHAQGMRARASVTSHTVEPELRSYYKQVVERLACPEVRDEMQEAGRRIPGPVVIFSVLANGKLEKIEIARSSGVAKLDDTIVKRVREAAPFEPFSPALLSRYGALDFTSTWRLTPTAKEQQRKPALEDGRDQCIIKL